MTVLAQYWARLEHKPQRLAVLLMFLVAMLLITDNLLRSAWSRVGFILNLFAAFVLAWGVSRKNF